MNEENLFPKEDSIHTYVDGLMSQADSSRMEVWLDHHPERAEEIRRWRRDAQQLRAELGGLPEEPSRAALDPAAIRTRHQRRLHRRAAIAAMLALAVGAGGVGGWQIRGWTAPKQAPMADALQAYRMFALDPHRKLDVMQRHPGQVQAWLDLHFRNAPKLPDLARTGFDIIGARLLAVDSGPAAIVVYKDYRGDAISFYIRPPTPDAGALPRGRRRAGNLAVAYWSGDGYNYALVSLANVLDRDVISRASS